MKWVRSTLKLRTVEINATPSANIAANSTPMAVSSRICPLLLRAPIPNAVAIPAASAPTNNAPCAPPPIRYPTATPGRMACASASPKKAMPRSTT